MAAEEEEEEANEIRFLQDAVALAYQARAAALHNKSADFMELRQLDMDIKTCEEELTRVSEGALS